MIKILSEKINQANLLVGIITCFTISGIILSVYLVQQRQTFSPKAAEVGSKSVWEQKTNPFGDSWSAKAPTNPAIPIGAGTTTFTSIGPDSTQSTDPNEINYLGNSNGRYLYDDGAKLLEPNKDFILQVPGRPDRIYSSSRVKDYLSKIKQINPNIRYIGYLTPNELIGYYNGYEDIIHQHPEWIVTDINDGHRIQVVYSLGGGQTFLGEYLMDIGNPNYRQFIAQKAAESMRFHGFGGVLLDQFADGFRTGHTYNGAIPESYSSNWQSNVRETIRAVKQAAPEMDIFLSPYDQDEGYMSSLLQAGGDGYFFENPLGPRGNGFDFMQGSDRFGYPYTIRKIGFNINLGKKVIISQSNLGSGSIGSLASSREDAHDRYNYYLALYMMFFFNGNQGNNVHYIYFNHNLQGADYFKDSDMKIGNPTGNANGLSGNQVWLRNYEKGRIYLNLTSQPFNTSLEKKLYDSTGKSYEGSITISPNTGLILGDLEAIPGQNSAKGDINQDGKVDLFDFNLLVGGFNKAATSPEADFNNDNFINIWDFSAFVSIFNSR